MLQQQQQQLHLFRRSSSANNNIKKSQTVEFRDLSLDEEAIQSLFAWVCCAFSEQEQDPRYNNLVLAFVAIFGRNLPHDSIPVALLRHALQQQQQQLQLLRSDEDDNSDDASLLRHHRRMGQPLSQHERESASLGAMGAAQWLGQWQTRPHALLETKHYRTIDDWERSLSRGCRRTLQRSLQQNFTVIAHPIPNNAPAPHSTLEHFRCVVEHEVRLLASSTSSSSLLLSENDSTNPQPVDMDAFLTALSAGIQRYVGTTQMAGEIREYRDLESNRVLAFAHEVRKGRTLRGQWFYGTDEASKRYIWFHSVRSCVERAIQSNDIDVVDLGPSGSDAFSQLKAKYGFRSVVDWPLVANYRGPFWDYERDAPAVNGLTY